MVQDVHLEYVYIERQCKSSAAEMSLFCLNESSTQDSRTLQVCVKPDDHKEKLETYIYLIIVPEISDSEVHVVYLFKI